eukprot:COSAG04_NODE_2768_length_3613_cov_10.557769_4_plen_61_part_00
MLVRGCSGVLEQSTVAPVAALRWSDVKPRERDFRECSQSSLSCSSRQRWCCRDTAATLAA